MPSATTSSRRWEPRPPPEPRGHRGAARRDQHPVREGAAAVSGSHSGFAASGNLHVRNEHANCVVPHQRHPAARLARRLRSVSRPQLRRQPEPDHRGAAGAIRPAHGGRRRHHDRDLQQCRGDRCLRRQPADRQLLDPIRRQDRQHGIFLQRPLYREHPGDRRIHASINAIHDFTSRTAASPMYRPSSIRPRA